MERKINTLEQFFLEHKQIIYGFFLLLSIFMHFYHLASVPNGLHVDEAGMAYDAYCIANYSVDRYLNYMPVYLINFGHGQSALNAYLVALLIKICGGDWNYWLIRIPSAVIGVLFYITGVRIIRKYMGDKWGGVSAFWLAVFPYFIMQSRFGLDCNLLLGITTIGLYILLLAIEKQKNLYFILAGIIWGISYYAYVLSYIGSTLFLGVLLCYLLYIKKISWRQVLCFGMPIVLLVWPLIIMVVINVLKLPQIKTNIFTIPRLPIDRTGEMSFTNLWDHFVITLRMILTEDGIYSNSFPQYYTMYRLSIPFAILGIVKLTIETIKSVLNKKYSVDIVFAILFYCWIFLGILTGEEPTIYRVNGIFFALFYCVLYGIRYAYYCVKEWIYSTPVSGGSLKEAVRNINFPEQKFILFILFLYTACFIGFIHYYFGDYSKNIEPSFMFYDTYEEITQFIETETGSPKSVYVDNPNIQYVYYFLTDRVNPFDANISENGTRSYWKYVFGLPEEIDTEAIYIVKTFNNNYINKLSDYPFEVYTSGMYSCYYMK